MRKSSRRQLQSPVSVFWPAVAFGGAGVLLELTTSLMMAYGFSIAATVPWMLVGVGLMVVGLVQWLRSGST